MSKSIKEKLSDNAQLNTNSYITLPVKKSLLYQIAFLQLQPFPLYEIYFICRHIHSECNGALKKSLKKINIRIFALVKKKRGDCPQVLDCDCSNTQINETETYMHSQFSLLLL